MQILYNICNGEIKSQNMNKEYLKNVIVDQRESIKDKLNSERIVKREGLSKCDRYLSSPNVLLISGLRRVGKSFFSHLLCKKDKYAFINFDDERLIEIETKDLNVVLECFYELYQNFNYILLDEIQNVKGWELFVNRLRNKYKVIITGSNANLLSSELATHLTGRFITFSIFPLGFKEFLRFNSFEFKKNLLYSTETKSRITSLFLKYLKEGGIFEYYKFGKEFLRNLFSSIITKDIIVRYKIKYPIVLEELALLLVHYWTSKISVSNLTKSLKIKSSHTVRQYIEYLENTFLIFTLSRFSYKIKEQLSTFKKVYIIDNGIINSLVFNFSQNKGKLLENLAAVEFKKRSIFEGFEIFYWSNYNVECDFIIKKGKKITSAYQICSELTLKNKQREVNGLIGALKEFNLKEGFIFTEAQEDEFKVDKFKVKVIPMWKWLIDRDDAE